MTPYRIAVIGYGAIAKELIERLQTHATLSCQLGVVFREQRAEVPALPSGVEALCGMKALMAFQPDLVIEAAGQIGGPCDVKGPSMQNFSPWSLSRANDLKIW